MRNQILRAYGRHLYRRMVWCGEAAQAEHLCVGGVGCSRKVLLEPTVGEQGVYVRERVVVQMEKWLQIVKYIRDSRSQVSHGYRREL